MKKRIILLLVGIVIAVSLLFLFIQIPYFYIPGVSSYDITCAYDDFLVSLPESTPISINRKGEIIQTPFLAREELALKLTYLDRLRVFNYLKRINVFYRKTLVIDNDVKEINNSAIETDAIAWDDVTYAEKIVITVKYKNIEKTLRIARYEQKNSLWAKNLFFYLQELFDKYYYEKYPSKVSE